MVFIIIFMLIFLICPLVGKVIFKIMKKEKDYSSELTIGFIFIYGMIAIYYLIKSIILYVQQ